jgi:cell division protein FtsB
MNMNPLLKRALTACILLYLALNPANARSGGMRWGTFLLDSLDKEIAKREAYAMQRDRRISELSGMLNSGSGLSDELRYSLNDRLYQEYYGYKCDSVLSYLNSNVTLAKKMGNASYENSKLLRLCFVCASSGMYLESKENLDAVRRGAMERDTALLEDYYFNFVNLYNEMALYSQDKAQTVIYKSIHDTYLDSLRKILAPGSNREIYYREEDMKWKGDYDSALVLNSLRMGRCDINTPAYSVVCFQRGLIYEMEGDSLNSLRFMIKSAISDIVTATKDNASMNSIANVCFSHGDLDRAVRYTRLAMDDAKFYNAKLRYSQISSTQPIIEQAYLIKSRRQNDWLKITLITLFFLLAVLTAVIMLIERQKKTLARSRDDLERTNAKLEKLNADLIAANEKMAKMNSDISEAGKIKEEYIGLFLGMCSEYIDKLASYRRLIKLKVNNGQTTELKQIVNTPDLISQELRTFYSNFDSTFLHIYPSFVKDFNALLRPEARLTPKKDGELTTELRIFALIRIGIDNSAQIAKLLRYSPQTIYNYRSTIKNKAAGDKDGFEGAVMKIGME